MEKLPVQLNSTKTTELTLQVDIKLASVAGVKRGMGARGAREGERKGSSSLARGPIFLLIQSKLLIA